MGLLEGKTALITGAAHLLNELGSSSLYFSKLSNK